jgi:hypothetical protein
LDFGFWIEEGDWEVLGPAGDLGFEIWDFRLKIGIGRFWARLAIWDLRFGIFD